MPDILLTEDELDVLSRCSGTAVKAYLRLRSRMDFASGVVGVKSGISYQALREWTEEAVEKGAGETVLQPSLKNIRTAVDQLVRRGLLRRAKTEKLVFQCLLARTGEVRPKQTRHEPGRAKRAEPGAEPGTEYGTNPAERETSTGAGFGSFDGDEPGSEPGTEPGTNPAGQNGPNPADIRYPIKPSTPQAAYTPVSGVDADEAIAAFWSARKATDDRPADEAVTRRATELAVWCCRNGVRANSMNPTVIEWATKCVGVPALDAALALARRAREEEGSSQPVNLGYLNAKLQSVLNPPKPKAPPWWASASAMEAKAREMGIAGARPGEEMEAFKGRITAAIRRAEGGAAA